MQSSHINRIKLEDLPDQQVWILLKKGDRSAFVTLFNRYADRLYAYGLTLSNDTTLSEDCLQELFLRIWETRSKLSDARSVEVYLLVAMRRLILRALKKERAFTHKTSPNLEKEDISPEARIIHQQIEAEQERHLQQALAKLSPRQREVVHLRFFTESEYSEICQVMDIDYQSARDLLYRAIKKLRTQLSPMATFLNSI